MPRCLAVLARAAVVATAALFAFATPIVAQTPEESFRQGVDSFRAGQYQRAIEYFEAARDAGLDTGALHFNLGVAYYRAGRVEAAEAAFRRAARTESMGAPALYQLGRIARERGDIDRAGDYFRRAVAAARTGALRRRARAALAGLTGVVVPDYVYLSLGGGHDSNLSLTPSDASGVSEESDLFLEGALVLRQPLGRRNYLRASAYVQQFLDEDDFSLISIGGGIGRVGTLGEWRWDAFVDGRHEEFGGDAFEDALIGGGELSRALDAGWLLDLRYRLQLARGASGFDFLDGSRQLVTAALDERGAGGWYLAATLDQADRDDRETANDFFSFSWTGVGLAAEYGLRLAQIGRLYFGGDWRHRDYDGAEIRDGVVLGEREDDRVGLEATFEHRLAGDWTGRYSLRVEERDSNLAEFDYDRTVIRARIERLF